ncbi:MAG: ATP-binding protein [Calditrichaceae bacterium]
MTNIVKNRSNMFGKKSRLNLQGKFFVYFSGLVVLMVCIVSASVFYFQKQTLLRQAQEKAFSLTRTLAYSSLNAILLDDYITLQILIDSMSDGPDIISIALLDTTGKVIASNTPELRGRKYSDPLTDRALATDTFLLQSETGDDGAEIWDTAVPIFELNRRVGTARIKYSVEDTYKGLLGTIIGIGIAAILISLFLSYSFARSISQPIRDVVDLASEYGKGNLDANLEIERTDEIGELVHSLNTLSHELKTLIDERIANENLIMIGEFSSYIIHDLKNPLSGIHLLADGLHRKLTDDSPLKKYSTEILLASQKLEDFTKRTLDIARSTQLKIEPIRINELIEHALDEVHLKSIPVVKKFNTKIPEIPGDYQMLQMALKNLLTNAAEAIDGKGQITIQTSLGDDVKIMVADTGIGIPEDRLATIFRPFFSMKNEGHGLGLAMVKKAVIAHRGKIDVESKTGEGSAFTISLPKYP